MKRSITIGALAALVLAPAAVDAQTGTKTYTATLTGAQEVPGPGDTNGRGSAVIKIRGTRLCFDIKMRRIDGAAAAHIHKGERGEAGDVVVALFGTASDRTRRRGCVRPGAAKIAQIRSDPRGHYVNVHNADFPNGAIRGQLRRR